MESKYEIGDRVVYHTNETEHGWDMGEIVFVYQSGDSFVYEMKGRPNVPVHQKEIQSHVNPNRGKAE